MSDKELKPLWSDVNDPESYDVMDSDIVIYNLYEDIKCQKEEIEQLTAQNMVMSEVVDAAVDYQGSNKTKHLHVLYEALATYKQTIEG